MQKFFENFTFFDLKWKNFFLLQEMVGGGGEGSRPAAPPPFSTALLYQVKWNLNIFQAYSLGYQSLKYWI